MKRGYMALIATIIISLTLLAMASERSFNGWYLRDNILKAQAKAESAALAAGCLDQTLLGLNLGRSYLTYATTTTYPNGHCVTGPIDLTDPSMAEITIQAIVRDTYTTLRATATKSGQTFDLTSWQELTL